MPRKEYVETLCAAGFSEFTFVSGRLSIADIVHNTKRSGIYCLEVDDDYFYVGKSKDIVRRFKQHLCTYGNVINFSYYCCNESEHSERERNSIHMIDRAGIKITNNDFAAFVHGEKYVDDVINVEEQKQWLSGTCIEAGMRGRFALEEANREKTYKNYTNIHTSNYFGESLELASAYTRQTIPAPCKTEQSFWSVSITPVTEKRKDNRRIFCFNMHRMETFVLAYNPIESTISGYVSMSREVVERGHGKTFDGRQILGNCYCYSRGYKSAGYDQVQISFNGTSGGRAILSDMSMVEGIRDLNLRVMGKGGNFYPQYHCFRFADDIFETL